MCKVYFIAEEKNRYQFAYDLLRKSFLRASFLQIKFCLFRCGHKLITCAKEKISYNTFSAGSNWFPIGPRNSWKTTNIYGNTEKPNQNTYLMKTKMYVSMRRVPKVVAYVCVCRMANIKHKQNRQQIHWRKTYRKHYLILFSLQRVLSFHDVREQLTYDVTTTTTIAHRSRKIWRKKGK